ncbi:deoxyuridine 5'-triphosphate nucleotidohydrolase [Aeribacillus sp. FSL K6-1121]|uniref:dUTP diphosphatase n=1 Tax=Aeribacillus sp. FSL K6-1121 TaxID=2954745 RepID=UPI0030FC3F82
MTINVKIKRLHPDAVIPRYAHEGDSGFDLVAIEDTIIEPGETKLVRTGLAFELPPGYEIQVRPRSGISLKTKLRVVLGTVDSGFRGEIGVIVDCLHDNDVYTDGRLIQFARDITNKTVKIDEYVQDGSYIIRRGDRIAQAVIKPVEQAYFIEVGELDETERGKSGFGSSGVK